MVFFFPYFGGFAMTRSYTVYIANSKITATSCRYGG